MALAKHNSTPAEINRRSILSAMVVAPALAVPVAAMAETETPVMALYRRIKANYDGRWGYTYDPKDGPTEDEAVHALFLNERSRLEKELFATPSRTAQDMAAKMVVGHAFGDHTCLGWGGPEWAEARALIAA